jgi:hypothetical protein
MAITTKVLLLKFVLCMKAMAHKERAVMPKITMMMVVVVMTTKKKFY